MGQGFLERSRVGVGLAVLTLLAAWILGYHPYAEDGGIYVAEIKRLLDPGLYPFYAEFVSGHLGGWPGFADAVAWMVRTTGSPLDWVMLGLHLGSLWGLLVGAWGLASRCYAGAAARWGAVGLVSVCCGVPVAGTSLMLVDPYATARSVAVAFTVLAMGAVVESRSRWRLAAACGALALAVAAHPLMGGYGVMQATVLCCLTSRRRSVRVGGVLSALGVALLVTAGVEALAKGETSQYRTVAATRYYWFLGEWQWYELLGVVAPLAILGWIWWKSDGPEKMLAAMGVSVGGSALLLAGIFAREAGRTHAVARMQPLRCFWMVYLVMLIVLGARLGEKILRMALWRWTIVALGLGSGMWFVQAQTYPASGHLELPEMRVVNRWEDAFLWIRQNTPNNALFGLDADYVHRAGEDAQVFRAVTERSVLPDYSKDGGQAAIRPELTEAWVAGQEAQAGLTKDTDKERTRRLAPLGVTWVVMGRETTTGFVCPYENEAVKVCRMP